jgi:ferredoxin--NADP+ reductase
MTYVITQSCCNDGVCIDVCPTDCIHPTPGSAAFATAEQLYIDPTNCVDCNACAEACPVGAIYSDFRLPEPMHPYLEINAGYFAHR